MAALSHVQKTAQIPMGDRVMVTFRVPSTIGTASAVEWIATGLKLIDCVVGFGPSGTAGWTEVPVFMINAQGSGVTEGTNPGDLGVEVTQATHEDLTVTVIGIP